MYILYKPLAIIGTSIIALSAIFCPFLRVPLIGNWNLYQTDMRLFLITYGLLGICTFLFFIRKIQAFRIMTFVLAVWAILAILAVYFTINNYFGFKFIDGIISKTIHFKWGWFVFFIGIITLIVSTKKVQLKEPIQEKDGLLA